MSYKSPAIWVTGNFDVTNVAGTDILVAAGGATAAYRVVYFKVALNRSAAAGATEGDLQDGIGASWRWVLQSPNWWESTFEPPFPGVQWPVNAPIQSVNIATIAGPVTIRYALAYYVDTIS